MLPRLRARRPSPALVIALIALFVAMGGTATALQGSNTVFSDDIVNGEVKTADIGTGHVRSPDLLNGGVRGVDIQDGGVTAVDIANAASGSDAVNADTLDGLNSTQLVRRDSHLWSQRFGRDISPGLSDVTLLSHLRSPSLEIEYTCPSSLSSNGAVRIRNWGNTDLHVFSDNGGSNPNHYVKLSGSVSPGAPGQSFAQATATTGEHIILQAQEAGVGTVEIFSIHTGGKCHVQGQGLFTYPP